MTDRAFLIATAGLFACSAAMAAETSPAVVRPAAACGGQGLVLPGTDTCLRLGGMARAEAATRAAGSGSAAVPGASATPSAGARASRLRAQGRVDLDARTETSAGPIRAFLSVRTP